MKNKPLMRRTLAGAALVATAGVVLAGVFAVIVPSAAGEGGGSGCQFPDEIQPEQALELTSTTSGGVAAVVLTDGLLGRCFSGGNDIGYRQVPFEIELVKRSGGPDGVQTVDSGLSQLRCLDENELCFSVADEIPPIAHPTTNCPHLLDFPASRPEDTVAVTTFTLDDSLVATIQAMKTVHSCSGGNANVYILHEVIQERRKRRDGESLFVLGSAVEGFVCFLDDSNSMVSSCKQFNPEL